MKIINLENKEDLERFKDVIDILCEEFEKTKFVKIFGVYDKVNNATKVEFVFHFEKETCKLIRIYDKENYGGFFQNYNRILHWDSIVKNVKSTSFNTVENNYFEILVERKQEQIKYTWSEDGYWCYDVFDSIEECIKDAKVERIKDFIYIGKVEYLKPKIDAISVIENVKEEVYREYGELAEEWELRNEKIEELEIGLNKCLYEWLEKTNQKPNFYEVYDIERVYFD